jgi:hypothetical protein
MTNSPAASSFTNFVKRRAYIEREKKQRSGDGSVQTMGTRRVSWAGRDQETRKIVGA